MAEQPHQIVLGVKVAGPGAAGGHAKFRTIVLAEDNDTRGGMLREHAAGRFQTAGQRHVQIHCHQIGTKSRALSRRFGAVPTFQNFIGKTADHVTNQFPAARVVINNHQFHSFHIFSSWPCCGGLSKCLNGGRKEWKQARNFNCVTSGIILGGSTERPKVPGPFQLNWFSASRFSKANCSNRLAPVSSSFSQMLDRCDSTVRGLINNSAAISLLVLPAATRLRMRFSATVKSSSPGLCDASDSTRLRRRSRKSLIDGLTYASCRDTAAMQFRISSAI